VAKSHRHTQLTERNASRFPPNVPTTFYQITETMLADQTRQDDGTEHQQQDVNNVCVCLSVSMSCMLPGNVRVAETTITRKVDRDVVVFITLINHTGTPVHILKIV